MRKLANVVFAFCSLLLVVGCSRRSKEERAVQEILAAGSLADLPKSASEIKTYGWNGLLQGEAFLAFKADAAEIDSFIKTSPCLMNVTPKEYGDEHKRLPLPEDFFKNTEKYAQSGNEYHELSNPNVPWYPFMIDFPAKRYEIYPSGGQDWGEVIVDTDKNVVYVQVVWN